MENAWEADATAPSTEWIEPVTHEQIIEQIISPDGAAVAALIEELATTRTALAAAERKLDQMRRVQARYREVIQRLNAMALTDVLTELGNRRRFDEALKASFTMSALRGTSLSVIMIDVDAFKLYNDSYGHAAGDDVLCAVARQLKRSSREYDVVTRYGGEEFAILLPDADLEEAAACAERHREAIERYDWPLRRVTASFGVAARRPEMHDLTRLVDEADRALYLSKRQGKNRVTHLGMHEPGEPAGEAAVVAPGRRGGPGGTHERRGAGRAADHSTLRLES